MELDCTSSAMAVFFLFFLLHLGYGTAQNSNGTNAILPPNTMLLGATYSADGNPKLLQSSNQLFTLELETWVDSDNINYCLAGVRYVKKYPTGVMWSFSRGQGQPQQGSACELSFSKLGVLSLTHDSGIVSWTTNTSGAGAQNLSITNEGNLILQGPGNGVVWQSFDETEYFILPSGKRFTKNDTLFQRMPIPQSPDFSTPGKYSLRLSHGGDRLLLVCSLSNETLFVYHSIAPPKVNASDYAMLGVDGIDFYNSAGSLLDTIASTISKPNASSLKSGLFMGDGNLILNYWNGSENLPYFNTSIHDCEQPGFCGDYSLCNPLTSVCSCPPGFVKASSSDHNCMAMDHKQNMAPILVSVHPQLSSFPVKSQDECLTTCNKDPTCNAAIFDSSLMSCSIFPILFTVVQDPSKNSNAQILFLKIPANRVKVSAATIASIAVGICVLLCLVCGGALALFVRKRRLRDCTSDKDENFLQDLARLPPRFSLKDLQVATNNFSMKLGAGGVGSVYEGVIASSGTKIAVKRLDQGGASQSKEQFRAEVATIGSISHVNLVVLKGFCMERNARLLVYEFMVKGSLDRWLFEKRQAGMEACPVGMEAASHVLDWETRCKIALHTARGLEYLHHHLEERIVHCDVKPENILLDEHFNAKVADFGLAKLIAADNQSFAMTTIKGTRGYLAPEWLQEATITAKSDVYSYGVVLLELISGCRSLEAGGYLPSWALSIATSQDSSTVSDVSAATVAISIDRERVKELLLDERIRGEVTSDGLERVLLVALACVSGDPMVRPTMAAVVQMLEGVVEPPPLALSRAMSPANTSPYAELLHSSIFLSQEISEHASSVQPEASAET